MSRHDLIASNRYMTVATADAQGAPWISPVWFAPWGDERLLWVSDPEARHSRNIAARPEVAIVVFDSTVAAGAAEALYLEATAEQLAGSELDGGIAAFAAHSVGDGLAAWSRQDVTAPAKHRLYCAFVRRAWTLGPGDERIPLA